VPPDLYGLSLDFFFFLQRVSWTWNHVLGLERMSQGRAVGEPSNSVTSLDEGSV
jgi:hypothetical protein